MSRFWQGREVSIVVPARTARLMIERALDQWGPHADAGTTPKGTSFLVWPAHDRGRTGLQPGGQVSVAWESPGHGLATIHRISWDHTRGWTEQTVQDAVNSLVGWPVVRGLGRTS